MPEERVHKVYNELNLQFMAVLDQELILNLATRLLEPESHFSGLRQLGQGSRFRVYEMTLRPLHVVLKIPITLYSGLEYSTNLDNTWNDNLNFLKNNTCYLVPPFQNYSFRNTFIQVMPLFELIKTSSESMSLMSDKFNKSLSEIGLRNNDTLQIGFLKGIPFALDLSDIEKV